jgi:hypothetical protein
MEWWGLGESDWGTFPGKDAFEQSVEWGGHGDPSQLSLRQQHQREVGAASPPPSPPLPFSTDPGLLSFSWEGWEGCCSWGMQGLWEQGLPKGPSIKPAEIIRVLRWPRTLMTLWAP